LLFRRGPFGICVREDANISAVGRGASLRGDFKRVHTWGHPAFITARAPRATHAPGIKKLPTKIDAVVTGRFLAFSTIFAASALKYRRTAAIAFMEELVRHDFMGAL
jgi:hypothetical protein